MGYHKILISIYGEKETFPNKISCGFNHSTSLHLMGCPWPHKCFYLFQTLFFYCSCNVNLPTCQTLISKLPFSVKYRLWNRTDAREHVHDIKYLLTLTFITVRNCTLRCISGWNALVVVSLLTERWLTAGFPRRPAQTYRGCFARWEIEVLWVCKIISGVMKIKLLPWSRFYGHVQNIFKYEVVTQTSGTFRLYAGQDLSYWVVEGVTKGQKCLDDSIENGMEVIFYTAVKHCLHFSAVSDG